MVRVSIADAPATEACKEELMNQMPEEMRKFDLGYANLVPSADVLRTRSCSQWRLS